MSGEIEAAGDIATGALVGRAVEPTTGELRRTGDAPTLCLNCGTRLRGDYCQECGQPSHIHRNLHSLLHDLLHGVFHFEGKIWRTLPMLFTRPGELTRRYIAGERARFVSPLALFLFSVFLMVATVETIGGPIGGSEVKVQANAARGAEGPRANAIANIDRDLTKARGVEKTLLAERAKLPAGSPVPVRLDSQIRAVRSEIRGLVFAERLAGGSGDLPADIDINTGSKSLDKRIRKALDQPALFLYKLQSTAYKFSWALIPISLPFIWLLFAWRRQFGPYDHAIFAIYSLCAMTLGVVALSIANALGAPGGMIATVLTFGPPLHMYKQLRGAYQLRRLSALWRTIALVIFASLAGFLFLLAVLSMISGE